MKTNILHIHILMTILFLLVSSANAAITVKTIEGEELLLYEQSYALVVGNCDYQNFIRLPGAKQDVEEVAKALERKGFIVELALNLTGKEFKTLFTNFALNRGNKENTRMLFYYAGHGATLPMAGKDTMGYLVMIDTPKPDKNRAEFVNKSVDMQYMVLQSQLMTARHVLYMFDSCFSGTILNFRSDIKPGKVSRRVKYPVRQFITAGSADEEVPDKSYFKQVFLDLIEGRVIGVRVKLNDKFKINFTLPPILPISSCWLSKFLISVDEYFININIDDDSYSFKNSNGKTNS